MFSNHDRFLRHHAYILEFRIRCKIPALIGKGQIQRCFCIKDLLRRNLQLSAKMIKRRLIKCFRQLQTHNRQALALLEHQFHIRPGIAGTHISDILRRDTGGAGHTHNRAVNDMGVAEYGMRIGQNDVLGKYKSAAAAKPDHPLALVGNGQNSHANAGFGFQTQDDVQCTVAQKRKRLAFINNHRH